MYILAYANRFVKYHFLAFDFFIPFSQKTKLLLTFFSFFAIIISESLIIRLSEGEFYGNTG